MYFNIQIYARQLRDSQTTIPYQTRDIENFPHQERKIVKAVDRTGKDKLKDEVAFPRLPMAILV